MYKKYFKRLLDLWLSICLIIAFAPIMLIVLLVLTYTHNGKPLFRQIRPGMNEKTFSIVKFKTMTNDTDQNGALLPDVDRLTRVGAFLRKTSLDELPQIFNVLKGEMSFIGPRPLLISYLPYYTTQEKLRHCVRPGITGLAQVSGRNFLPWDERLKLDVEYTHSICLTKDLRIVLKTIQNVITRKDVEIVPEAKMKDLKTYRKDDKMGYFF